MALLLDRRDCDHCRTFHARATNYFKISCDPRFAYHALTREKESFMKRILLPIIVLAFTASYVLAADAPPGPNPKLKELAYFAGNWHCEGNGFAFMGTPEHKTSANVEASWTLNNY